EICWTARTAIEHLVVRPRECATGTLDQAPEREPAARSAPPVETSDRARQAVAVSAAGAGSGAASVGGTVCGSRPARRTFFPPFFGARVGSAGLSVSLVGLGVSDLRPVSPIQRNPLIALAPVTAAASAESERYSFPSNRNPSSRTVTFRSLPLYVRVRTVPAAGRRGSRSRVRGAFGGSAATVVFGALRE